MSSIVQSEPVRAIRNALERLSQSSESFTEERALIEEALAVLEVDAKIAIPARALVEASNDETGEIDGSRDRAIDYAMTDLIKAVEDGKKEATTLPAPAPDLTTCDACSFLFDPDEDSACPRCDVFGRFDGRDEE